MAEYIEKQSFNDAIREAVRKYPNTFYNGLEAARQIAHNMSAADVQPFRHGRWINHGWATVCSECGEDYAFAKRNYCPNCGARMDGGET